MVEGYNGAAAVDRHGGFYNFAATRLFRRHYRRIARDISVLASHGAAVLDIGTGPGVLLAELARLRPDLRLTGVDLSPAMVAAARRNVAGRATVQVGDVAELPFASAAFDVAVSTLSMHHWDDPAAAVPELARVLRPGGRLLIYDFRRAPFDRLIEAARRLPVLTGQEPARTPFRAALIHLRLVRLEMSNAG